MGTYGNGALLSLAQKGLDALWLKQSVLSSNLANIDTPGYKARTVSFEAQLAQAIKRTGGLDEGAISSVQPRVGVDSTTSLREDGNNVDVDAQNIELARVQMQYEYLIRSISSELERRKYVLSETK